MNDISVLLPQSVENLQLPNPSLITYYKDLENRTIWIDSQITEDTLEIVKRIMNWNRGDKEIPIEKRAPIKMIFWSFGGDLEVYRTLSSIIRLSKTPIYGINVGMAYSASAMIFLSCHKRLMVQGSSILFHQGSSNFSGTYQEVCSALVEYQKQIGEMGAEIKKSSTYTEEEIDDNICSDWYISADEALAHGICDEIVSDISQLL